MYAFKMPHILGVNSFLRPCMCIYDGTRDHNVKSNSLDSERELSGLFSHVCYLEKLKTKSKALLRLENPDICFIYYI